MKHQAALTVQESFKGSTLRLIQATEGKEAVFQSLNSLLFATNLALNVKEKLNEFQAFDIVTTLMCDYADVKLEEMIYIFKQGKKGLYGPHYNKLDIETIINWINGYFKSEEYNIFLENRHKAPIEKVELDEEQKKGWKDVLENLNQFSKSLKKEYQPNAGRLTLESWKENLLLHLPKMSKEELNSLLSDYKKVEHAIGIELITNELNKRQ